MSGLEALGTACAIFQTISFSRETLAVCRAIYQGQKTPDSVFEEKATAMVLAAQGARQKCDGTNIEDKDLIEIAGKCIDAAEGLDLEVKKITLRHKKGEIFSAIRAGLRSVRKKKKIEELDKTLCQYRDTMQILLINKICDQRKAGDLKNHEAFQSLSHDLQSFILKIEAGFTTMEDLLKSEGTLTRNHVTCEMRQNEMSIMAHVTNVAKASELETATQEQRKRLLKSLKFDVMNQRRHGVMDPKDATFEQIFRSYEKVTNYDDSPDVTSSSTSYHSIDTERIELVWKTFIDWLRSSDSLFWIQGKPGSGKSTLVNFLINHKSTQNILNEWHPKTKMLSHFFWKIGNKMQHNIGGLYCTLLHELLEDDVVLVNVMMERFSFLAMKDYFSDWNTGELGQVLHAAIEHRANEGALCVFIDGLDEYCGDDGQQGLVDRIERLAKLQNVKLCVASRAEPRLRQRLEKAPNLKLHELTGPDMMAHILREFDPLQSSGKVSAKMVDQLASILLDKAEGVFLWLHLAMKSVQGGIQDDNEEDLLMMRLEQLPGELSSLYEEMWKRLNQDEPIYRESAAMFFQLVITRKDLKYPEYWGKCDLSLTLLDATYVKTRGLEKLLGATHDVDYDEIRSLCGKVEKEIYTRCAGLLVTKDSDSWDYHTAPDEQKPMRRVVDFVHRTAHDFLVETETGKKILDYGKNSAPDLLFEITKANLCRLWLDRDAVGGKDWAPSCLHLADRFYDAMSENEDAIERMIWVLNKTKSLYDKGSFSLEGFPRRQFASFLADVKHSSDFAVFALENADAARATDILGDLNWGSVADDTEKYSNMVLHLLSCGADPGAVRAHATSSTTSAVRRTAMWEFLTCLLDQRINKNGARTKKNAKARAKILRAMAAKCPPSAHWGLVASTNVAHSGPVAASRDPSQILTFVQGEEDSRPIFEANMAFFLTNSDTLSQIDKDGSIQARWREFTPTIRMPFIAFCLGDGWRETIWFRVIDQKPLDTIIELIFHNANPRAECLKPKFQEWYCTAADLSRDPSVLEEVGEDQIMDYQADESRFGICRPQDVGISWDRDLRKFLHIEKS